MERSTTALSGDGTAKGGFHKDRKGLKVYATINSKSYETKRPVESTFESDKQKNIIFDDCLPKWNYLVKVV